MLDNSERDQAGIPIGHFLDCPGFLWCVVKIKHCHDLRSIGDIVHITKSEKVAKYVKSKRPRGAYAVQQFQFAPIQ